MFLSNDIISAIFKNAKKDKSSTDDIQKRILLASKTLESVEIIRKKRLKIEEVYGKEINVNEKELLKLQKECGHVYSYHYGCNNNDSYYECMICGKTTGDDEDYRRS